MKIYFKKLATLVFLFLISQKFFSQTSDSASIRLEKFISKKTEIPETQAVKTNNGKSQESLKQANLSGQQEVIKNKTNSKTSSDKKDQADQKAKRKNVALPNTDKQKTGTK
jgi:hypothetical protein